MSIIVRITAALTAAAMLAGVALPLHAQTGAQAANAQSGESIPVTYAHVALNTADPQSRVSGRLGFLGGLIIHSTDARFGGISGLLVSEDGSSLLGVTDTGYWVSASLAYSGTTLDAISNARMAPLLDTKGMSVATGKSRGDAEGLARGRNGTLLVSFERDHRVWAYDYAAAGMSAPASPVAISPDLADARNNQGLEAIETLVDGSILALTEGTYDAQGHIRGWRVTDSGTAPVALKRSPPFDLTDAALLPSGGLLTLERRFSMIGGVGAQMRLIEAAHLNGNGPLDGDIIYRSTAGHTIDNMEGLAVRTAGDGTTLIYVVSDDNFNPLQRTILLMFELLPAPAAD